MLSRICHRRNSEKRQPSPSLIARVTPFRREVCGGMKPLRPFSPKILLILNELWGINSSIFRAFSRHFRDVFVDSKRVKWRIFGEIAQIFS